MDEINKITEKIIACAIEVHRELGPGLLESAYRDCLAYELSKQNLAVEIEKSVPVQYKKVKIDCAFRADIIVDNKVIIELKAVEKLLPVHEAQLLTYMKLTHIKIGLIINFNVRLLKNGIKRLIL
jgi:GxxExxY protein